MMKNWEDAKSVFRALNENYRYLVIRNFETFYESIITDLHADIDILCERNNKKEIVALLGAKPRLKKNDGIHYKVQISSQYVSFDIRCIGDGYYDKKWASKMLQNRVYDERGFYHMDKENYFWSLLYHALYHKGIISDDYYSKLSLLNISIFKKDLNEVKRILHEYMMENDYYYTIGRDKYMWYHFNGFCHERMHIDPIFRIRLFLIKCKEYALKRLRKVDKQ